MANKDKTMYVCSNCGQESTKWIGKCPSCGQWNTFKEIKVAYTRKQLAATTAAASAMCQHDKRSFFVNALWNAKHEPYEDGYFDAYYDGLLRLFAFMHLSGRYRVIEPQ